MAKSGKGGMWLHQTLSFSPVFSRMSQAEAIFWPGCALMNLEPQILQKTVEILRRAEPQLGLCSCCCGQPTRYLFPQSYDARQASLTGLLQKRGIKRIYTACPNCTQELSRLPGVEVIPIWGVLARHIRPEDLGNRWTDAVTLHDPCPLRKDAQSRRAVRELLALAGIQILEPEQNGEKTLCCGNFQMLRAKDPEKSAALRSRRIRQFQPGIPVTSPCEGCLDAFRSEGLDTAHVLELLFGKSASRGWGSRIAFTLSVRK